MKRIRFEFVCIGEYPLDGTSAECIFQGINEHLAEMGLTVGDCFETVQGDDIPQEKTA